MVIENGWLVLIGVDKVKSLFFELIQVLLATVCSRQLDTLCLIYIIN